MTGLVTNLLDMARLQAGGVQLSRQWLMLEEVVGAALRASRAAPGATSGACALATRFALVAIGCRVDGAFVHEPVRERRKYAGAQQQPGYQREYGDRRRQTVRGR